MEKLSLHFTLNILKNFLNGAGKRKLHHFKYIELWDKDNQKN